MLELYQLQEASGNRGLGPSVGGGGRSRHTWDGSPRSPHKTPNQGHRAHICACVQATFAAPAQSASLGMSVVKENPQLLGKQVAA